MVIADQFGLFVVGALGKLSGGEVLPVGLGADGAGHDTLLQLGQDLCIHHRRHKLRLDLECNFVRVVARPLRCVSQGLLNASRCGNDDAM
ncbi:hypothetical protein D3C81_1744680 [compost metagenome]